MHSQNCLARENPGPVVSRARMVCSPRDALQHDRLLSARFSSRIDGVLCGLHRRVPAQRAASTACESHVRQPYLLDIKWPNGIFCVRRTMTDSKLSAKLSNIYYSPKGYWKGLAAIKNLSSAAKVSEDVARDWLKKQAIWQIYLPAHDTSQSQNLMLMHQTRSTKPTCCFSLTIR